MRSWFTFLIIKMREMCMYTVQYSVQVHCISVFFLSGRFLSVGQLSKDPMIELFARYFSSQRKKLKFNLEFALIS